MALRRKDITGAAISAVIAWALLSFWIPSLRFTPFAFVSGIAVTLAYIAYLISNTSNGLYDTTPKSFVSSTALAFTSTKLWRDETLALKQRSVYHEIDVLPTHSLVSLNIDAFLDLLQRDFVLSWYEKVSRGSAFPNEVDRTLRTAVSRIARQVISLDFVQIGITRILPILNNHLKNFALAEEGVRGKEFKREVTDTDALDAAIAAKYRNGRLHPAASIGASKNVSSQQQHLRGVVAKWLGYMLPESMKTSDSVLVLARELVACAAILPILRTMSDPDILNQMIEAYGRSVLQERKTVRKLRAALEEHSDPTPVKAQASRLPKLSSDDSERSFEKFIRAIRKCNSLNDARRYRSEVAQQFRRDSANEDATYLKRLEVGIKLLDRQIANLSSRQGATPAQLKTSTDLPANAAPNRRDPNLRQTLYDASGLSYFMEYMDRIHLMPLVQFWLVVDGFRNPLESESEGLDDEPTLHTSWTSSEREDISSIYDAYLTRPELSVAPEHLALVKSFLNGGEDATDASYVSARRAIVAVQDKVFSDMNHTHFPAFKRSDLYFKWDIPSHDGTRKPSKTGSNVHMAAEINATNAVAANHGLRTRLGSATDIVASAKLQHAAAVEKPRRSLDDSNSRSPLFDDSETYTDSDTENVAQSTNSLASQTQSHAARQPNANAVEAVQARLDELIEEQPEARRSTKGQLFEEPADDDLRRDSIDEENAESYFSLPAKGKPSLASFGLLGSDSTDLFGGDEPAPQNPSVSASGNEKETNEKQASAIESIPASSARESEVREAAPGDLGLVELIQDLTIEIEKLERQQTILASLKKKAEITSNSAELRILQKSESDLERELGRKQMQKQQYMVQETENALYGQAKLAITNIMVGTEEDGHEFAVYVVEVRRSGGEKGSDTVWAVARRYSEFHDLHKRLRSRFPIVRDLDFPRRQMVLSFSKDVLRKRRIALEKYLRDLLTIPAVCRSIEFRAFLSQQKITERKKAGDEQLDRRDFVTRIYNSVTDGMEEFFGNMPALDQLSAAGHNLISAASIAATPSLPDAAAPPVAALNHDDPSKIAEAQAEVNAFAEDKPTPTTTFIQPICDIFLELFQLNQGNSWLRGRAVVVVLQQLLGGTVERKVRESFKTNTTEQSVVKYLALLKDTIWPDGKFRQAPPPRSAAEKARSKKEAGLILATLLPDMAGSVVGRSNAAKAGRRIFAAINNETLNVHLFYTIFDELMEVLFEGHA